MVEELEKGGTHDSEAEDLYKIAQELFNTDARSKLEEQERDILNRQVGTFSHWKTPTGFRVQQ